MQEQQESKHLGDGGPAFPTPLRPGGSNSNGMTLRDYFAGQALASLGIHSDGVRIAWGLDGVFTRSGILQAQAIADTAYLIADAMLKARKS